MSTIDWDERPQRSRLNRDSSGESTADNSGSDSLAPYYSNPDSLLSQEELDEDDEKMFNLAGVYSESEYASYEETPSSAFDLLDMDELDADDEKMFNLAGVSQYSDVFATPVSPDRVAYNYLDAGEGEIANTENQSEDATEQLDVANLSSVEKLAEAVKRSASSLGSELAQELQAIFTPATLATMAGVFAVYVAAHATGIGQAVDIGMLIAGGFFFGLDAFTIFRDIAGFANAVNASTEEDLDRAGEHLASAIAKIGVDAVMTLLTKRLADEVGRTIDNENQGVLARFSGILRDAVKGKGNFGLGSATRAEAMELGHAWVGSNYRTSSDGTAMISADGLRQFRPPSFKDRLGITQANFEWRNRNSGAWQGNGHLDIVD